MSPPAEIRAQEASFLAQEAADLAREQADRARERADLAGEAADQADERADLAQEAADLAEDWADEEDQNRAQGQADEMRRLADEMRERADQAEEAADLAEEHADLGQEHADEAANWAGLQHDGEKLIVRLRQWRPDLTRRGPEEDIPVPPPPPPVRRSPRGRRARPAECPSAVAGPALPWARMPVGPGGLRSPGTRPDRGPGAGACWSTWHPAGSWPGCRGLLVHLAPGRIVARVAAPTGWVRWLAREVAVAGVAAHAGGRPRLHRAGPHQARSAAPVPTLGRPPAPAATATHARARKP